MTGADTLTDTSSLVDGAFEEMECAADTKDRPHEGTKAAFYDMHGCVDGWLCQAHYQEYLQVIRPTNIAHISRPPYYIICPFCKKHSYSIDDAERVYPL